MTESLLTITLPASQWLLVRAGLLRIKHGLRNDIPLEEPERLEFLAGLKSMRTSTAVSELLGVIDSQLAEQQFDKTAALSAALAPSRY